MANRPTPTAIKLAQGNLSHRPINQNEPKTVFGAPPMPSDLSVAAQLVWTEMIPVLLNLGTLGQSDADSLANYCETRVNWRRAQDSLDIDGLVINTPHGPKRNPNFSIADACLKQLRALQAEFGLTAASRTKIHNESPEADTALSRLANERRHNREQHKYTPTN
jgi:P27 family predicted phage terminase small subunit